MAVALMSASEQLSLKRLSLRRTEIEIQTRGRVVKERGNEKRCHLSSSLIQLSEVNDARHGMTRRGTR
jgi:hypothetical protein